MNKLFKRINSRLRSYWLLFQVEGLKTKNWGRQIKLPRALKLRNNDNRIQVKPKVKITMTAKIIRADGTIEDLGVIATNESESRRRWLLF